MCILIAFNKRESWTFEELIAETGQTATSFQDQIDKIMFRYSRKRMQSSSNVNDSW